MSSYAISPLAIAIVAGFVIRYLFAALKFLALPKIRR